MGYVVWTKSYSASDNGSVLTGGNLQDIQNDLTSVVNGGLTNINVSASAAVVESKISFNTSTGHVHNGTDANYPLIKHYRRGMQVEYASATTVTVRPGVLDVAGKLFVTTASTTLTITTDFLGGEAEPADGPVYIYVYNNSGSAGFKMSTSVPELSDGSGNTAEFPMRYHLASTVYYRLIGIIHNRTDILPDMCNNFDLSNFATGSFTADGNDEVIYTGWTPNLIEWIVCSDATPANAEAVDAWGLVQRYGFNTAAPQPQALYYNSVHQAASPAHATAANGTALSIFAINAQTTAQSGSFTIDAPTNGQVVMFAAWSHGQGSL